MIAKMLSFNGDSRLSGVLMEKRIALVIEDNVELGYIYAAALEMSSFKVEHIVDGKQALQRLDGSVPDLIVLDMNLPHVSGHYIYKKLRSDERFATTPVIIATANALIAEALSNEIGARDHLLIKPVSPTQLRNLVKTMFGNDTLTPSPNPVK